MQTKIINWLMQKYEITIKKDKENPTILHLIFWRERKQLTIDTSKYSDLEKAKREISYLIIKKIFNVA